MKRARKGSRGKERIRLKERKIRFRHKGRVKKRRESGIRERERNTERNRY